MSSEGRTARRANPTEGPWFSLVYLFFAYLPLLFIPRDTSLALIASLAATAAFIPLHFAFFRRAPGSDALRFILPVALLGLVLIPLNPGGNTFIVYALAMTAASQRLRTSIVLAALLLAAMTLEFALLIPNLRIALALSAMVMMIALLVMLGIGSARVRARHDAELRLTQDEVRRLAGMAERERIGRDLHDLLGHTLSVVALKSELARKLIERDPLAAQVQIAEVEQVARQALAQVREAVAGIRASGLQAELAAARFALLAAEVRLDQRLAPMEIEREVEQTLAMVVREAVTNIVRHAQARQVEIELALRDEGLCLSVADDGRGGIGAYGNGLTGMRERVHAIGATLDIESPIGGGSRLLVTLAPRAGESAQRKAGPAT